MPIVSDPDGGTFSVRTLSHLTHVPCCVCDVFDAEPVGVGEDYEYKTCRDHFLAVQCKSCGLVFLNPRPATDDLDVIYPNTYHAYAFTPERFGLSYRVRSWLEARRLRTLCAHLGPSAKILDVGCGDGYHLSLLKLYGNPGWQLQGVDASARAVARARALGLNVHQGCLEDVALPSEEFDLILMIATIEHVANPRTLLEEAQRILKPNGRLVIVTDNVDTLDFRIWRDRFWGGYHFPRHWNLFTKTALLRLAERCHLAVYRLETVVSPVNWVYSIHNCLVDMGASPWWVRQFSLTGTVPLAFFTLWDQLFCFFGAGALLRATLRKEPA